MSRSARGERRIALLLIGGLLGVAGLWLATLAGAEDQPTVRQGVYGPNSCDNDTQSADTKITKAPKKKTTKTKARFEFKAFFCSNPDAQVSQDSFEFKCKLDKGAKKKCSSPTKYGGLKKGKHKFSVSANLTGSGAAFGDPTPDRHRWKIVD